MRLSLTAKGLVVGHFMHLVDSGEYRTVEQEIAGIDLHARFTRDDLLAGYDAAVADGSIRTNDQGEVVFAGVT